MRLHQLFQKTCQNFPNRLAVKFGSEQLTYQQLDERSNQLANYLLSKRIKFGDRIGIYFPRSLWQVTFMLALSKIGAVYVPFNPNDKTIEANDPFQKHRNQIKNCDLAKLIICPGYIERAKNLTDSMKILRLEWNDITQLSKVEPKDLTCDDEIDAYIINSSGTSGDPKGIRIIHAGLEPWYNKLNQIINTDLNNYVLAQISNGFDAHIWEYLMAWSCGGCSFVANDTTTADITKLVEFIVNNKITDLTMTPAVLMLIMSNQNYIRCMNEAGLQRVYLTGDELTPEIVKALIKNKIRVFNCYGPTELTFGYSIMEVGLGDIDESLNLVAISLKSHEGVRAFIREINSNDDSVTNNLINVDDVNGSIEGELLVVTPYLTAGYIPPTEVHRKCFQKIGYKGGEFQAYATQDLFIVKGKKLFYKGRLGDVIKFKGMQIDTAKVSQFIKTELKDNCNQVLVFDIKLENKTQQYFIVILDIHDESLISSEKKRKLCDGLKKSLTARETPQFIYTIKELGFDEIPINTNDKVNKSAIHTNAIKKVENYLKELNDRLNQSVIRFKQDTQQSSASININQIRSLIVNIITLLINIKLVSVDSYEEICNKTLQELGYSSLDQMAFRLKIIDYIGQSVSVSTIESKKINEIIQELISPYEFLGCFIEIKSSDKSDMNTSDDQILFCLPPLTGAISRYESLADQGVKLMAFKSPLLDHSLKSDPNNYLDKKSF